MVIPMGYLEEHLKKYPLMQIEDKIKLLMQATLGPAHLINDKEQVKKRIYNEYVQSPNRHINQSKSTKVVGAT